MAHRLALVVGGAGGIGGATCRALAQGGLRVVVADIDKSGADALAAQLPGQGHAAFRVDVTDESSIRELFATVETSVGAIVVLVCIAGGSLIKPEYRPGIAQISLLHWEQTQARNVRGTFLCLREFLRRREEAPVDDGRIITIGSLAGQTAGGTGETDAAYAASKAAIAGLTRCAAAQAGKLGITANTVAPGLVDTVKVRNATTPAQRDAAARATPLGRLGQPEEIAATIAFLASPQAGFLTGTTISVNGGRFIS